MSAAAVPAAGILRNVLLFAVMSAIWGLTWIAIKIGIAALPPFFFAASRFLTAGLLMLGLAWLQGQNFALHGAATRLIATALLVNTACYASVFWGMRHVPSGFSAIVNLSLMPVALFAIGLALGQERFSRLRAVAVALGVAGLLVMLQGRTAIETSPAALAGIAAVVFGTLAYCLGSVLSRPLADGMPPLVLSGLHCLIGGAALALLSLAFEAPQAGMLAAYADPAVLASWAFLVLGGSVVAYTIYLRLIRDWGPTPAGGYAFVSPAIAVLVGVAVFDERYTAIEVLGALVMLAATFLMLRSATR